MDPKNFKVPQLIAQTEFVVSAWSLYPWQVPQHLRFLFGDNGRVAGGQTKKRMKRA